MVKKTDMVHFTQCGTPVFESEHTGTKYKILEHMQQVCIKIHILTNLQNNCPLLQNSTTKN